LTAADPEVGQSGADALTDGLEQVAGVQFGQQAKGVAAADVDRLRLVDRRHGVAGAVDSLQAVAGVQAALPHELDVLVVVAAGVGDEQDALDAPKEGTHLLGDEGDALGRAEAARAEEHAHGQDSVNGATQACTMIDARSVTQPRRTR
jgi:hypothetical protein